MTARSARYRSNTIMPVQMSAPYARDGSLANASTLEGRLSHWEAMPNMRLGTFVHYRKNGHRAFATLDGSCCCHHGEVSGTIRAWLSHVKTNLRSAVRWSTCDCTNVSGLTRKVEIDQLPPKPRSYFELLKASSAERLQRLESDPSVEALATPLRCESGPVYLGNDGRFFCSHGNEFVVKELPTARKQACVPRPDSTTTPIKKHRSIRRRFRTMACDCVLVLPNRTTFPELPFVTAPSSG